MARHGRVKVTVTQPMAVGLEILSEREQQPVATVAQRLLRAALDRTIHSAEGQKRLADARAFQSRDEWLSSREDDAFELSMAQEEIEQ